jgi:hypothetical protein
LTKISSLPDIDQEFLFICWYYHNNTYCIIRSLRCPYCIQLKQSLPRSRVFIFNSFKPYTKTTPDYYQLPIITKCFFVFGCFKATPFLTLFPCCDNIVLLIYTINITYYSSKDCSLSWSTLSILGWVWAPNLEGRLVFPLCSDFCNSRAQTFYLTNIFHFLYHFLFTYPIFPSFCTKYFIYLVLPTFLYSLFQAFYIQLISWSVISSGVLGSSL